MALQRTVVDIPLNGTKADGTGAVHVEPPAWLALDNVRFTKDGYMTQRPGYGEGATGAAAFFVRRGETVYKRGLASILDTAGIGDATLAPATAVDVETATVANGTSGPVACDIARSEAAQMEIVAWIDGGLVYAQLRDLSGNPVGAINNLTASGQTFATAASKSLRVCAVSNKFAIFASSDAGGLYGWTVSYFLGAATWGSSVTVKAATGAPFDADSNDDDDEFIVAYWNGSATVLDRRNTSLASQGTATITSSTGATHVSVTYSTGRVLAVYSTTGGGTFCASYSDDLATTHFGHTSLGTSATVTPSPSAALSGSTWHVTWNEAVQSYNTISTTGTAGTQISIYGPVGVAGIFVHNSTPYIPCTTASLSGDNLQPAGLLMAVYGSTAKMSPVARFLVDRLSPAISRSRTIRTENVTASNHARFAFAARESIASISATATSLVSGSSSISRVDLTLPGGASSFAEFDGNVYFGGGQLWGFDGMHAWESTPHQFPENLSVAFAGSSGFLSAGSYSWKAVYEWEDANGILHRSAPSLSVTGTATSTQTATVKVPKLYATHRDGAAQQTYWVALYRTAVGGSVFYLSGRWPASALSGATTGYWDVADGLADAGLGEILYTEGGILEATSPPPVWDLTIAGGRMWIVSADRRNELWYSKKLTRGISPEFNAAQVIDVPDSVMCVRAMDDKVLALGETGIFAIYGDGPNDAGQGGTFTDPQRIQSPTGCLSRETVDTGNGILFGGRRGAYVLGRGLDVQWVSEAVSDSLTTGTFTGAVMLATNNEALVCNGSNVFAWNLDTGQWSRWEVPYNATGTTWHMVSNTAAAEFVYVAHRSVYSYIDCAAATYYDRNAVGGTQSAIPFSAQTGYIRPGSPNAKQRIWRIVFRYQKTGTIGLTVSFGTDVAGLSTFRAYTNAELDTAAGLLEIHVPSEYQRAEGLTVGFATTSTGGQYGTIELQTLSAVVGVRAGTTRRLPSTSRG